MFAGKARYIEAWHEAVPVYRYPVGSIANQGARYPALAINNLELVLC